MQQQQQQQSNYTNISSPGMQVVDQHDQYSYVDLNGVIQGPYELFQIQEWIQEGHFKPSVNIRQGNIGIFQDLAIMGFMQYKEDPSTELGLIERNVPYLQKNWYYIDRQGIQQGPFSYTMMYDWVVQGQLTPEIVARCGEVGPFTPIIKTAFMGVVPSVIIQQHPPSPLMQPVMHHQQQHQLPPLPPQQNNDNNALSSSNKNTTDDNNNTNTDGNYQVAELRKLLEAKESALKETIAKLRNTQEKITKERSENVQLKRSMEKLEEQSRANIAKIETLTIENQKMKRDKVAIKKQLVDQESKQKGNMKAYEKAFRSISNIIEQCKKDSIGNKSLYNSEKAPSSTSTTSGDLSSAASWANAAENEDNDEDTDDSTEEEKILLSPSGIKVKQNTNMKQRHNNNNSATTTPQHHHRYRQRSNSKDSNNNKKVNTLQIEKQSIAKKANQDKGTETATRGISNKNTISSSVQTPSTASKNRKRRNKNRNKNKGESKQQSSSSTSGKQNGSNNSSSSSTSKSGSKSSKSKSKSRSKGNNSKISVSKMVSVQSN